MCKVLHLSWDNSDINTGWGMKRWRVVLPRGCRDSGGYRLDISWPYAFAVQKAKCVLGGI